MPYNPDAANMAGIYIHIPFCKQACYYCDFHFSTNLQLRDPLLQAIKQELSIQRHYLGQAQVASIYLGGGTPSLLASHEVAALLTQITRYFPLAEPVEVTLEANPDDLTLEKLQALRTAGINRLSLGVQSFQDVLLRYLHRIHDGAQAIASVELALQAGFENISIDLIYAIPGQTESLWRQDLAIATQLLPPHIAAYCLTIAPNTVFGRWQQKGRLQPVADEVAAQHFQILVDVLTAYHYEAYEVTSFYQPLCHAQHNMNYWKQGSYLGVGPGAHAYNGVARQYNVAHNQRYIQSIQQGIIPSTTRVLKRKDHINEYIMTRLRTQWGCDLAWLKSHYQYDLQQAKGTYLSQLLRQRLACIQADTLWLTTAGKLLADRVALDLFID
ncbi:MAG: radical SAM family heme chaperone HemW [Bacteroidota bacterium]